MSRFFPHSEYAEDQPLARTLLTTHVMYRGFQSGATIGIAIGAVQSVFQLRKGLTRQAVLGSGLRSIGIGAVIGTGLMVPGLVMRMWGREEIEWKDRSWRLLENEGQKEVDDWSLLGTVAGAVAVARRTIVRETARSKFLRLSGGAGVGSMVGVMGYMVWRYGVMRGERRKVEVGNVAAVTA